MSNKIWFGCPNCHLAFSSKGEYERHYESDHAGRGFREASLIESRG
jgi:hypothetical protein